MKLTSILCLALAACSGDDHMKPDATPDAAPVEITIKLFANGAVASGTTANSLAVAAQDGDGAWQPLSGTAGVYHVTIQQARYAVAVLCAADPSMFRPNSVDVYARAVADGSELHAYGCGTPDPGRVNLTVTVAGLGADEQADVWGADTFDIAFGDMPAVLQVLPGHIDMLIRKRAPGSRLTSLVYRTAVDVVANKALTIDLAAVGKPPDHLPLAVTNVDTSEMVRVSTSFAPGVGFAGLQMPIESEPLASPPRYALVPAALRLPSDISNVTVTASRQTGNRTEERFVRRAMNPPIQPTITLPAPVAFMAPVIDATALRRATITLPLTASTLGHLEYHAYLSTSDSQAMMTNASWSLSATAGWSTDPSTLTYVMPDLSAVPGWTAAFALQAGPVAWTLERDEGNMPFETPPVDGRMFTGYDISDTLN